MYSPIIFKLINTLRWVVSFMSWPHYRQGKWSWYPMGRRLGGSQMSLDVVEGKVSAPAGFKCHQTLKSSHYIDWAILMMLEDSKGITIAVACVARKYKYVATVSWGQNGYHNHQQGALHPFWSIAILLSQTYSSNLCDVWATIVPN